jgi:hypothetical protein
VQHTCSNTRAAGNYPAFLTNEAKNACAATAAVDGEIIMNPWLVRLRQRREIEQIGEKRLQLIPVDVPAIHTGRTFSVAITDGWLARHHPALWKKVQALDAVLSHMEERVLEDSVYEQRLHELTTLCQQVEDLRCGE